MGSALLWHRSLKRSKGVMTHRGARHGSGRKDSLPFRGRGDCSGENALGEKVEEAKPKPSDTRHLAGNLSWVKPVIHFIKEHSL